jgi:hypothetical protein
VFTAVEEQQWVAAAVERGEVKLVEARGSHGPFLAILEDLRRPVMLDCLLAGLKTGQALPDGVEDFHLLQERRQQLAILLFIFRGAAGRGALELGWMESSTMVAEDR